MDKPLVKLSREVADELQGLRNQGWSHYRIISHIYMQWDKGDAFSPMAEFAYQHNSPFFRALADGFEVEQTPEDKVREYYNNLKHSCNWSATGAIDDTLEMLNMKIPGINA